MKNNHLLQSLGFDAKAEEVYRALLSLADAPAAAIAKRAGVKRTSAYHVLEKLIDMGLVSSYTSRGTHRFYAEHPSRLKKFFEERAIIADRILPELQKDAQRSSRQTSIRFVEGVAGIRGISEESLECKEQVILTIGSSK